MKTTLGIIAAAILLGSVSSNGESTLFENSETFGIAGFRMLWDEVIPLSPDGAHEFTDTEWKDRSPSAIWAPSRRGDKPGMLAFDALQRSLLVRFPGAAERIAEKINGGAKIEKAELILPFRDTELWPVHGRDFWDPATGGYSARRNWDVDKLYRSEDPTWHATAWALRRPWSGENPELGPTFNAFIKGAGYWAKYGAQDEKADRFPERFGPTEVSSRNKEGAMDITAVFTDPAFGADLATRLRLVSDNGFLVKKWETYDHRFFTGVYEWATATGGRAILIDSPKLRITFAPDPGAKKIRLPAAPDIAALAEKMRNSGTGGQPTAVMPSREQILEFNKQLLAKPDWMPDWQYNRVMELYHRESGDAPKENSDTTGEMFFDSLLSQHIIKNIAGRSSRDSAGRAVQEPGDIEARYAAWVDMLLARQPRGWEGFSAAREMTQWYRFSHALPGPARDAITANWSAWLMSDRETHLPPMAENGLTDKLIHPMWDQLKAGGGTGTQGRDSYWKATGDWRGNKSFYRSGFCYTISTQNFNMTSSSGALLGGAIIGSENAIRDGRHGVRSFPFAWAWNDGSTQEHIDHYYFSVTMSGNKALRDYSPTPVDRLLGESILAASVEELAGAWHPGLRRFLSPSSRTHLNYVLGTQEGIYSILHTLSPKGALLDLKQEQIVPPNMPLIGQELLPRTVANQSMGGPWAPEWIIPSIEDKTLPFHARHTYGDVFRTAWLGRNYGLASASQGSPRIKIMGHWRREEKPAARVQDVTTMLVMPGINNTNFIDTHAGVIAHHAISPTLQHENKMLIVTSPMKPWVNEKDGSVGLPGFKDPVQIRSFQTSIALYQSDRPTWSIYALDPQKKGQGWVKVDALPFQMRQGTPIAIHDGVTYFAAIPLPATDLGRDAEVILREGDTQVYEKIPHQAALVIDSFFFRSAEPLKSGQFKPEDFEAAYGGFFIQMADSNEFKSFEDFQKHIAAASVEALWDPATKRVKMTYTNGGETLETEMATTAAKNASDPLKADQLAMKINGKPFGLPEGIRRDTTYIQQGTAPVLEKGGATLHSEPGNLSRLYANPAADAFEVWQPRINNGIIRLRLPEGQVVMTDGRAPLMRIGAMPKRNLYQVDYAWENNAGPTHPSHARTLYFLGLGSEPQVVVNGKTVKPTSVKIDGKTGYAIPLQEKLLPETEREARFEGAEKALSHRVWPDFNRHYLREWHTLGGLPGGEENFAARIGPEAGLTAEPLPLGATFSDTRGATVQWQLSKTRGIGGPRPIEGIGRIAGSENSFVTKPAADPATFFLYAEIESDADREAIAFVEIPAGEQSKVLTKLYVGDQEHVIGAKREASMPIRLRKGTNPVLVKFTQTVASPEPFSFRFRLANEVYGHPVLEQVYYRLSSGLMPVNPADNDPRIEWNTSNPSQVTGQLR